MTISARGDNNRNKNKLPWGAKEALALYCKFLTALFFFSLILLKYPHSTLAPPRTLANHIRISPSKINQDLIVGNKVPPGEKCYNIPSLQSIQSLSGSQVLPTVGAGGEGDSCRCWIRHLQLLVMHSRTVHKYIPNST